MSIANNMLLSGCARHVEALHGEQIEVLTGLDSGKTFVAVIEQLPDVMLIDSFGSDPRAKTIIRFVSGVPRLTRNDIIKTSDGRMWGAVADPQLDYLSSDFEVSEIIKKDQS